MARIAVVEDEEAVRTMMVRFLELRGHEATGYGRLREAWSALEGLPPELLIVDLRLPDGSGLDLVARMRGAHGQGFPILILSGLDREDDFKRGFAAGADDYLRKPFLPDELLAKCEIHLARYGDSVTQVLQHGLPVDSQGRAFSRYEILETVGRGSFGVVYRAFDIRSGLSIALKVLNTTATNRGELRLRFLRETYALGSVKHPNVVGVRDFGSREGRFYYAMDYVDGPTLRQQVAHEGGASPRQALEFLLAMVQALGALQQVGLVHRDLKPSNVILRDGDWSQPVLVDFGLAKRSYDSGVTHEQLLMGTPAFMAPEALRGVEPSIQSDLFSLGLVARFALLGDNPFPTLKGVALLDHMARVPIPYPDDLPGPLRRTLSYLTAMAPAERPKSAGEAGALVSAALVALVRERRASL